MVTKTKHAGGRPANGVIKDKGKERNVAVAAGVIERLLPSISEDPMRADALRGALKRVPTTALSELVFLLTESS